MRILAVALVVSPLLVQPALAQRGPPTAPQQSDSQKARLEDEAAARRKADRDYKAALKQLPDKPQAVDPWGNMRAPTPPGAK